VASWCRVHLAASIERPKARPEPKAAPPAIARLIEYRLTEPDDNFARLAVVLALQFSFCNNCVDVLDLH
jgi:hypothetical protein